MTARNHRTMAEGLLDEAMPERLEADLPEGLTETERVHTMTITGSLLVQRAQVHATLALADSEPVIDLGAEGIRFRVQKLTAELDELREAAREYMDAVAGSCSASKQGRRLRDLLDGVR